MRAAPHNPALTCVLILLAGCAGDTGAGADVDVIIDSLETTEVITDTADTAADATADSATPYVPVRDYCETVASMFCDYYLRCGRMAVDDVVTCLTVFDESCNANYEPLYARQEEAGRLRLSTEGVATCEAHLRAVACTEQLGDLDGGCATMWEGRLATGGDCGPGIESLVCDPASTCVLGLDFCGTCQPVAAIGAACGDGIRCPSSARCVDDVCVARGLPGASCDDDTPCVIGARCETGRCVGYEVVVVGAICDQTHRCQYKAACVGGVCVSTVLQGEACDATTPCASGDCESGTCVAAAPAAPICLTE